MATVLQDKQTLLPPPPRLCQKWHRSSTRLPAVHLLIMDIEILLSCLAAPHVLHH